MTLNPAQSQARPVKIRHVAPATVSENAPAPDGANAPAKRLALPQVRSAID
jgi:hypothetical protein